ncbi:GNAT family N-acetyltransferase [Kitasatospora camelliae]|uniref:GNAT family N-acetyltransferase n=1 Tax=Kitasatospora camelliae TaxID=3156397 RepID=A0AAU8K451_9ACTN
MTISVTPLADPARTASSHRLAWLASGAEGAPAGSAYLRVFTAAGQDHLAELEIGVHPAERRRGVGSRLLEAAVDAARQHRRRSVIAQAVADSPAERFLAARGFRKVLTLTYARLDLATADHAALAAVADRPHPGYRLTSWQGTVPEELIATFTASRRAMDDMPMDDTDYGTVVWDEERVRSAAAAIAARGEVLRTVAVVAESTGAIVGFTELVVPADGTGDAQHYGTAVLPEHRGRGLARWLKAAAVRDAREHHPALAGLLTDTADSNHAMRGLNDSLGYAPTHRSTEYQLDLG